MSKLTPQQAEAALQEAITQHRQGELAPAEKAYARILKSYPDQFDALHLLGLLKLQTGKAGEAHRLIAAALRANPASPDALANLGLVLTALKRPGDALASLDKALALDPDHFEALANRGNILLDLDRAEEALVCFIRVLARDPNHVPALVNRGNALLALGQPDAAIREYDDALRVSPSDPRALVNRATALFRIGRYAEAVAGYDRVLAFVPGHAEAMSARGQALQATGRHHDALESYAKAIALAKDFAHAHFNEALALLTIGEYGRGFQEYEWRWKRAGITRRNLGKPLWLGEYPLGRKTILLHAEQGLGDTLMFVRYAPLLARAGAKVLVEVQPALKRLLAGIDGISVIAQDEKLPPFDVHSPLGSLPLAHKTTLASVPADIPYLRAPQEHIAKWRPRLEALPGKRVALAFAGNPDHINDRNRSIALERLRPLFATPGVSLVSVQRDVRESDRETLEGCTLITDLGRELADFSDTAAVLALADLVVTVDTSLAHLAGALGRPGFVLLPFWPDWRWTLDRDASPWYPDLRLFRQSADGSWDPVIERVRSELAGLAS